MSVSDVYSQYLESPAESMFRPYKRARSGSNYGSGAPYRRRPNYGYGTVRRYGRVYSNPVRIPRGPASRGFLTSNTEVLNPTRGASTRFVCTVDNFYVNATGGGQLLFDPSGVSGTGTAAQAFPNWTAVKLLYDQFKVNSITVTMNCKPSDDPTGISEVWYCSTANADNTGTKALVTAMSNAMHHTFTPDTPMVKYQFVPKKAMLSLVFGATLANQGFTPIDAGWCDIDHPPTFYGFTSWYDPDLGQNPGTSVPSSLDYDVTWDISFRSRT